MTNTFYPISRPHPDRSNIWMQHHHIRCQKVLCCFLDCRLGLWGGDYVLDCFLLQLYVNLLPARVHSQHFLQETAQPDFFKRSRRPKPPTWRQHRTVPGRFCMCVMSVRGGGGGGGDVSSSCWPTQVFVSLTSRLKRGRRPLIPAY